MERDDREKTVRKTIGNKVAEGCRREDESTLAAGMAVMDRLGSRGTVGGRHWRGRAKRRASGTMLTIPMYLAASFWSR